MKRFFLLFLFVILFSSTANAKDKVAIVATVGDEAITNKDILYRLKIMIMSSGQQGDSGTINRLTPQALEQLIDEKMFISQAKKLDYKVDQKQIDEAIEVLEKQNNMPENGLLSMMTANDVPHAAMFQKLEAEISHAFLVAREVTPKIKISDGEVEDFLKAESQVSTSNEYFIKEIVLPVDLPEEDEKILALARDLKKQIQEGADFAALAEANSKSPSLVNGGSVGWLDEKQIPQEIMSVINQQGLNKILGPIKSVEGYYLVIASEMRVITTANDNDIVELRQFSKLPKNQAEAEEISSKISSLNNVAEACLRTDLYAQANGLDAKNFGRVRMGDLPSGIRGVLSSTATAQFSKPISAPSGITSFIVCERSENTQAGFTDEQKQNAREILKLKRIDLAEQKYRRELRQKTNIDVRL
jgi:peptidyl-prolyl cis-trans isomerase SurA